MKSPKNKMNVRTEATCYVCHEEMEPDFGVRSNSWFEGILGARLLVCSTECRDVYDTGNLAKLEAAEVEE